MVPRMTATPPPILSKTFARRAANSSGGKTSENTGCAAIGKPRARSNRRVRIKTSKYTNYSIFIGDMQPSLPHTCAALPQQASGAISLSSLRKPTAFWHNSKFGADEPDLDCQMHPGFAEAPIRSRLESNFEAFVKIYPNGFIYLCLAGMSALQCGAQQLPGQNPTTQNPPAQNPTSQNPVSTNPTTQSPAQTPAQTPPQNPTTPPPAAARPPAAGTGHCQRGGELPKYPTCAYRANMVSLSMMDGFHKSNRYLTRSIIRAIPTIPTS